MTTDPPTKESLAQLIIQLIQYQETKLGKNAQDSAMTTRLPVIQTKLLINITFITLNFILDAFLHGL